MYCHECGEEIPDNSNYCPECGTQVENTKEETNPEKNNEKIMEVKGHNGQIELYDDRLIINRKGVMAKLSQGFDGNKEIYLDKIKSIKFEEAGKISHGHIKFNTPSNSKDVSGLTEVQQDENTVMFNINQEKSFKEIAKTIYDILDKPKENLFTKKTSDENEQKEKQKNQKDKGWKYYLIKFAIIALTVSIPPIGAFIIFKSDKFKKTGKIVAGLYTVFFISLFFIPTDDAGKQTNKQNKAIEKQSKSKNNTQAEIEKYESYLSTYNDFMGRVSELEGYANELVNEFSSEADKLAKGKSSVYKLYDLAKNAKSRCREAQMKFGTEIEPPENLPGEVRDLLNKGLNDLSTAYHTKKKGMDYAMKFLNNQQPKYLSKFKEESRAAQSFVTNAAVDFNKAKSKIKTKLSELKEDR